MSASGVIAAGARPPLLSRGTGRRRLANAAAWATAYLALAAIAVPTVWVAWGVVARALPHWRWSVLTTPGSAGAGGLENEILGTLVLMLGVLVLSGAVGVASGVYLSEYARGRLGGFLRAASEVLAGIPSIVLGYCGYIAFVVSFHWGFSLAAGLITLAIMTVPYVAKTTEVALRGVPTAYREGAEALGMTPAQTLWKISLKASLPGITTGLLVAAAIAMGETAPLLYTAGFTQALPSAALTHHPVPFLTYAVWTFYNQPSQAAVALSYDAALILLVMMVALILLSRLVVSRGLRHRE